MNLSASIYNYTLTFTASLGTVTWNGVALPPITTVATNYALLTMSLELNGMGRLEWDCEPVSWLDPQTGGLIPPPPNITVKRESAELTTILDFNTTEENPTTFEFRVNLLYEGQLHTFEPTIVNIKPGG